MSKQSGNPDHGSLDHDGLYRPEAIDPAEKIRYLRRAELDLEEILNDPRLTETRQEVASMINSCNNSARKESSKEAEVFIKRSLVARTPYGPVPRQRIEIKDIKIEIGKSNIDDLTAEWVREWHRKKQTEGLSPADEEIKNFIASSLADKTEMSVPEEKAEQAAPVVSVQEKAAGRKKIIRFASITAAAVLGIFIAISSLAPSVNTEKIFVAFYQAYPVISETTRGGNSDFSIAYESALNDYRSGQYQKAEAGFTNAVSADPSNGSSLFYLGLSQIETGNIDQAVNNLSAASTGTGRFNKEAQWYLGLAYLKKGDMIKAGECFGTLAAEDGFYRRPSERILRRLK